MIHPSVPPFLDQDEMSGIYSMTPEKLTVLKRVVVDSYQ